MNIFVIKCFNKKRPCSHRKCIIDTGVPTVAAHRTGTSLTAISLRGSYTTSSASLTITSRIVRLALVYIAVTYTYITQRRRFDCNDTSTFISKKCRGKRKNEQYRKSLLNFLLWQDHQASVKMAPPGVISMPTSGS